MLAEEVKKDTASSAAEDHGEKFIDHIEETPIVAATNIEPNKAIEEVKQAKVEEQPAVVVEISEKPYEDAESTSTPEK